MQCTEPSLPYCAFFPFPFSSVSSVLRTSRIAMIYNLLLYQCISTLECSCDSNNLELEKCRKIVAHNDINIITVILYVRSTSIRLRIRPALRTSYQHIAHITKRGQARLVIRPRPGCLHQHPLPPTPQTVSKIANTCPSPLPAHHSNATPTRATAAHRKQYWGNLLLDRIAVCVRVVVDVLVGRLLLLLTRG